MPKNRSVTKSLSGAITRNRPAHKLRIGTRKSGVSALLMSTKALVDIVNNPGMKRYRNNALAVLKTRSVSASGELK